jgi:hypothetical protein
MIGQGSFKVRAVVGALWMAALSVVPSARGDDASLRPAAEAALRKAITYFAEHAAVEGGYVYRASQNFSRREGEHKVTPTMVWVQPPGTPTVGLAYLKAYEATGEAAYLDAARRTAGALLRGQLRSGGWDYTIEFDPKLRTKYAYRVEPADPSGFNVSTYDDNNTQACVTFLMRLDTTLKSADGPLHDSIVHESVVYALQSLLAAQYPNGAWPQRYSGPIEADKFPVTKASYPDTWPRQWPKPKYTGYYTFNDNTMGDIVDLMLEAARVYDEPKYRKAAEKCGDFMLLAQMPEPQPAWAQQYDAEMHPAWARKFEPPAITGGESQSILKTLLTLYRATGEQRFIEAVPRPLEYLEASRLADGRLARFYELRTNKPLYMTKSYEITYSDADMPTHYSFKTPARMEKIRQEYDKLRKMSAEQREQSALTGRPKVGEDMIARAKAAIDSLDDQGRWLEPGRFKESESQADEQILVTETFVKNVERISLYLAATRGGK